MSDDQDRMDELAQRLHSALADVFHAHDGSIVNRWVVLADVMDTDGVRSLMLQSAPDMKSWDTLGMLEFAKQAEQAGWFENGPT